LELTGSLVGGGTQSDWIWEAVWLELTGSLVGGGTQAGWICKAVWLELRVVIWEAVWLDPRSSLVGSGWIWQSVSWMATVLKKARVLR